MEWVGFLHPLLVPRLSSPCPGALCPLALSPVTSCFPGTGESIFPLGHHCPPGSHPTIEKLEILVVCSRLP